MTIENLAIFGGPPAFAEKLYVGRPNVGSREELLARVADLIDRRWLTNDGPYVQELEQRIAGLLGVNHCIAVCNGTIGLELAIRALGLTGEVIVPSFTFVATAHALQWQKITPVFCDIDPRTHTIDPARIEELVTARTTGIIGVHLWGNACNVEAVNAIARKRGLKVLFDAAHAFVCSQGGTMVGNFGDAEVFSFHATKFFNTFEGGAIATNNDELAAKIRLMKNFGFAGYDNVVYIGTNGKMSEVCAAMGIVGLDHLDEFIEINRANHVRYLRGLEGVPGLTPVRYNEAERCNYQYVVFEVDELISGIGRDELVAVLHAENVIARRYFYPGCHRMEPYRSLFPEAGKLLPITERVSTRCISMPTGSAVDAETVNSICALIRHVVANAGDIRERLSRVRQGGDR